MVPGFSLCSQSFPLFIGKYYCTFLPVDFDSPNCSLSVRQMSVSLSAIVEIYRVTLRIKASINKSGKSTSTGNVNINTLFLKTLTLKKCCQKSFCGHCVRKQLFLFEHNALSYEVHLYHG